MKKLNKMEIGALASKISSELRKEYNDRVEKEKEVQKKKFLKTPLGTVITTLLEYPEGKNLLNNHTLSQLYYKGVSFGGIACLTDIENAIIIAQIDCPDLETLITTVKESLKE